MRKKTCFGFKNRDDYLARILFAERVSKLIGFELRSIVYLKRYLPPISLSCSISFLIISTIDI